jgi:hypothetical protein
MTSTSSVSCYKCNSSNYVKLNKVNNGYFDVVENGMHEASEDRSTDTDDKTTPGKNDLQFLRKVVDLVMKDGLIGAMDRKT